MFAHTLKFCLLICALSCAHSGVWATETIKIAIIDRFESPIENNENFKAFKAITDRINAKGGVLGGRMIEIVAFDHGYDAQKAVEALNQAIDQHIAFVTSTASNVVLALDDAISKHNDAHPDARVLLLNYGAKAPALTEEKCSFWHFRFSPNTTMDLNLLTTTIASQKDIRKVYVLNQDYSYGQSVSKAVKEMLHAKRSDIKIVGDEFVPLLKIKDFSATVANIENSGADALVTGNWGDDLFLLLEAAGTKLKVKYFITIPDVPGTARAIADNHTSHVIGVFDWNANVEPNPYASFNAEYKTKYHATGNFDFIKGIRVVEMLAQTINKAGSADPTKVAYALEGIRYRGADGEAWMRPDDHQLVAPVYLAAFGKAGIPGIKFDEENTGQGWKTIAKLDAKDSASPVKCKMTRPH